MSELTYAQTLLAQRAERDAVRASRRLPENSPLRKWHKGRKARSLADVVECCRRGVRIWIYGGAKDPSFVMSQQTLVLVRAVECGAVFIAVRNRAIPIEFQAKWDKTGANDRGYYVLESRELTGYFSTPLDEHCAFIHARTACDVRGWFGPFTIRFRRDEIKDIPF